MPGRTTRLKRPSFVPTLQEICEEDAARIPGLEDAIRYWAGTEVRAADWIGEARREWGSCGHYMCRGEEVIGFSLYCDRGRLHQFERYPFDYSEARGAVLACVVGDLRTEKRLVVRMIRDLRLRGVPGIRAVASDGGRSNHASTHSLLQMGWQPQQRSLYLGRFYTLFGLELGNTVEAGELARALLGQVGQVRLPQLRPAAPGSLASRALDEMKHAFEESDPNDDEHDILAGAGRAGETRRNPCPDA